MFNFEVKEPKNFFRKFSKKNSSVSENKFEKMCIQKTKYSSGLKDCNFHKPEEDFLQKVRKFLAQLSKTIRQSNTFSNFCFLKKFHQTRKMQIWHESWKAVIESLEIFRSKARTFIDNLSRKNPKKFFCTHRKQFWRTGWRIFNKSPKSIHSNSEKIIEKEIKIFETIFETRWRQFRQTWWTVLVQNLKASCWFLKLVKQSFSFRKN